LSGARNMLIGQMRRPLPIRPLAVRSGGTAVTLLVAATGLLVITAAENWRTAIFATAVAGAIAATRVRFAPHAAAVLLATLAVLAGAGAGVGSGRPALKRSRLASPKVDKTLREHARR
jgi:hypothetical protein